VAARFTVGPLADDADFEAYGLIVKQVYNSIDDVRRREWVDRAGRENVRVVRDGSTVAGGLVLIPMGQWFGGRSLPMTGVAAVAVSPEHRGRGAATTLMRAAVREMGEHGVPLSSLFPMTQPLYRAVGYERAGVEFRATVPTSAMVGGDRSLAIRAATPADEPAIEEVCRRRARVSPGNLERGRYVWERIRRPTGDIAYGYVVEGAAGIEGYVYFVHREKPGGVLDIWCNDLVALTPAAARRLVALFADHRSSTTNVAWRGSPGDPLLAALREQAEAKVSVNYVWMLRLVDVAAALTGRGYAAGVAGEVHLDVAADGVIPGNGGRWLVRVADGRAEVERGGRGSVRTDVRGLAALYTGFQSPAELRAAGLVDADDASLAVATSVFGGPQPWMADHF
jgi:predicted acetyltransferase